MAPLNFCRKWYDGSVQREKLSLEKVFYFVAVFSLDTSCLCVLFLCL